DVIPNRITYLKLRAETPGVYRGQCAEFCAISHANMRARAIAQTPSDFDTWVRGQLLPASMPADPLALGRLTGTCAVCHTIRGIPNVGGATAPDLTHFGSRTSFAGSSFEVTAANLFRWIDNPSSMKPLTGTELGRDVPTMKDYGLSREEIDAIVAYLLSLK
ncbi:MAG: c-type cytochrome, partial [Burkholderiales bacterium]